MADETTIVEVTPHDSWFEFDITEKIKSALQSGFMSDLTVQLRDGKLRCHSLLLGFASPMLAAMIQNSPHEIVLSGVTTNTFKILLRIIYSKEAEGIKTDVEKIQAVAKIAHELKIYTAVTYCTKLLREILNTKNVCSILNLACHLDKLELKEACARVIQEKTDEVLKSDDFLKCNFATLEHILKQECVGNVTELDLFQAAVRWAKRHDKPREALGSNLGLIRFRTFTIKDIAAYVKPAKILTKDEEQELLWYLLADGKGEMPAGFSNENRKRHITWIVDNIRANTRTTVLPQCGNGEYVTKEEMLASPPLRISVKEDAYLIGVTYPPNRMGKRVGDKYMEDVEVTLKDGNGILIAVAKLNSEVKDCDDYNLTFPHPVEVHADVTYQLKFSSNVPEVRQATYLRRKQIYDTKTSVKITVLEDVKTPISYLNIAPKV